MSNTFSVFGHIVDVVSGQISDGEIKVSEGRIIEIRPCSNVSDQYILPGLIDAHVHIESSMLVPVEFSRLASVHGTVATVSDPHEIANVLGVEGVEFMLENARHTPFRFFFGAPSCVPATGFESSGAMIDSGQIASLLGREEVLYLSEMMNFPGVVHEDAEVLAKLEAARRMGKPVDGHAPGLKGEGLKKYAQAGISTDHECSTLDEALEKVSLGMNILIREGSAARNFDALAPLINICPDKVMLCSDDKHPDDLAEGHINQLLARAVAKGCDAIQVIRTATLNPVKHYRLPCGLLQLGDPADMAIVQDLKTFEVLHTYIAGECVATAGQTAISSYKPALPNRFVAQPLKPDQLGVQPGNGELRVIRAFDGELFTRLELTSPTIRQGQVVSDIENDVLKMVVINRYTPAPPSFGFIRGFGFKQGALASTVAHDSHNLICVGASDKEMLAAINAVIEAKGGIAISSNGITEILPLPVGGLMTAADGYKAAEQYAHINVKAKSLGGNLRAPFMTLSFMGLLVIPELKLSDKGLFDGTTFSFTQLFTGD